MRLELPLRLITDEDRSENLHHLLSHPHQSCHGKDHPHFLPRLRHLRLVLPSLLSNHPSVFLYTLLSYHHGSQKDHGKAAIRLHSPRRSIC